MSRKDELNKEVKKMLKIWYILIGYGIGVLIYTVWSRNIAVGTLMIFLGVLVTIPVLIKVLSLKVKYSDVIIKQKEK